MFDCFLYPTAATRGGKGQGKRLVHLVLKGLKDKFCFKGLGNEVIHSHEMAQVCHVGLVKGTSRYYL